MVIFVSGKNGFIHPSKEAKLHFQFPEEDINIIKLNGTILFCNKVLNKPNNLTELLVMKYIFFIFINLRPCKAEV